MRDMFQATELKADGQQSAEKMLDKTLADSFPTSDPPSTIPNPGDRITSQDPTSDNRFAGMHPGSDRPAQRTRKVVFVAGSIENRRNGSRLNERRP
jgi:hypothetical protein